MAERTCGRFTTSNKYGYFQDVSVFNNIKKKENKNF
jgi:hypothetical protein